MSITELNKHQHVVPRFYLKQFSEEVEKDDFQIYCLYKLRKEEVDERFQLLYFKTLSSREIIY